MGYCDEFNAQCNGISAMDPPYDGSTHAMDPPMRWIHPRDGSTHAMDPPMRWATPIAKNVKPLQGYWLKIGEKK